MEERRYEIRQYGVDEWISRIITESELKRRLEIIADDPLKWNRAIDILLHGEKEQEITGTTAYGVARTDAWDEWVDAIPYPLIDCSLKQFQDWLRACPCRKRTY